MKMSVDEENSIALCMVRAAPGAGPSPMSPTPLEIENQFYILAVKILHKHESDRRIQTRRLGASKNKDSRKPFYFISILSNALFKTMILIHISNLIEILGFRQKSGQQNSVNLARIDKSTHRAEKKNRKKSNGKNNRENTSDINLKEQLTQRCLPLDRTSQTHCMQSMFQRKKIAALRDLDRTGRLEHISCCWLPKSLYS